MKEVILHQDRQELFVRLRMTRGNKVEKFTVAGKLLGNRPMFHRFVDVFWTPKVVSKGKVGYPSKSTRDVYQHVPPIYGLYNGCIGQYRVIFGEQLPRVPSRGYPTFPFDCCRFFHCPVKLIFRFILRCFAEGYVCIITWFFFGECRDFSILLIFDVVHNSTIQICFQQKIGMVLRMVSGNQCF